jgi:hypothetical protein
METKLDARSSATLAPVDVLDLQEVPVDRRAERLSRAFRLLGPGESFLVAGRGDPHHFEHFLKRCYPSEVVWIDDFDRDGRWIARVVRS